MAAESVRTIPLDTVTYYDKLPSITAIVIVAVLSLFSFDPAMSQLGTILWEYEIDGQLWAPMKYEAVICFLEATTRTFMHSM